MTSLEKVEEIQDVTAEQFSAHSEALRKLTDEGAKVGIFTQTSAIAQICDDKGGIVASASASGNMALAVKEVPGNVFLSAASFISVLPNFLDQGAKVGVTITIDDKPSLEFLVSPESWGIKGLVSKCLDANCLPYNSPDEFHNERNLKGVAFVKEKLEEALATCKQGTMVD